MLIDQNRLCRRRPPASRIFAINEGPSTETDGGAWPRVDRSGHTLILSADNPDEAAHPPRAFELKGTKLADAVVEVVWLSRALTSWRVR